MRALAIAIALVIPVVAGVASCASPEAATPQGVASDNDCAVIAAIANEHYEFRTHPAPPLKGLGDANWRPACDWSKYGLADFKDYRDSEKLTDPRERLKYVEFSKPVYDDQGAMVDTSIMHGPLAGMGYHCRVRPGVAGWTVGECKAAWVS